ncbi:MAG: helix-turn-helix transcriptional regulator [Clostridiales Family XIII bacterium]|jgi:DNA-binding CsgD family transcriptional regulator|nr:helix-turn-helix transcriptional regulator [Clostridiales Family XIII bacterium]
MEHRTDTPWEEIHELLLTCGMARNPSELARKMLESIHTLVPFDLGRIYSVNPRGEVFDEVRFGVDEQWPRSYYEYYSKILNGKYSMERSHSDKRRFSYFPSAKNGFYDWTGCEEDEFVTDYIRPQGIRYSFGFGLFDADNICKRSIMMDRTGSIGFSQREQNILSIFIRHMENLHRNFYATAAEGECLVGHKSALDALTARESEIAGLILKGLVPESIANNLFLSRATVYKHIAHIHAKLGVSSRQELMVKMMHDR